MHEADSELLNTTGVVLAGGASSRMGQNKARLMIGGEPLLSRVVGRLRLAFSDVLVIGPPEFAVLIPETRIVQDTLPGLGPLGGLEAALTTITSSRAFVVACDMPFVSPPLARAMAHRAAALADVEVVVLRTGRGLEPLHAVYSRACLPLVRSRLHAEGASARSLVGLLEHVRVAEMEPDDVARYDPNGLSACNANSPEDWAHVVHVARELPQR